MPLAIGETTQVQGSASKPYTIKNVDGRIWTCSCASWRNQSTGPLRTCKHIRSLLTPAVDAARLGIGAPAPSPTPAPSGAPVAAPARPGAAGALTPAPATGAPGTATTAGNGHVLGAVTDPAERARLEAEFLAREGRKMRQDEKQKAFGPRILLANNYDDEDVDPAGWLYSEKLDGCRAVWDGKQFVTRQGNVYRAPAWFIAGFPGTPLDGELWMGRGMFQQTVSIVKRDDAGEEWRKVHYMVFDAPAHEGPFEERIAEAKRLCDAVKTPWIQAHQHGIVRDAAHLKAVLDAIESAGGEGVMIRRPGAKYERCRSSTLLKVKPFRDDEAVVIGHTPGKKQFKGMTGGLDVTWRGKAFNVGSGLSHEQRRNPPKVGATVTFRYAGTTDDGIPKCASFVAVRDYE